MKTIIRSTAVLTLAACCFTASPALAQDVWIKGTLSLWLLAPKGEGDWSRMGRDSSIAIDAQLPGQRSLLWSFTAYDFPNKKGGAVDQFFLTFEKGRRKISMGRFYAPFGSEIMEKYDKYVEPNDPATVKNPFLDQFGDGISLESALGRATVTIAALSLALDGNSSPDLFARARLPLRGVDLGASYYREAGTPDSYASDADVQARLGPLTFIGQALTGRPIGERAKAHFAALSLHSASGNLFVKYASYDPESGPRAVTRKAGLSRTFPPLGTLRLWWQDNEVSKDQLILELRVQL